MESGTNSNSAAPFLIKTYEMIDDPLTNPIVSWSQSGWSFVVWDPPSFAQHLLPKYFKHNNFSSFVRQLNTYGFRKIDPDQWEFANEEFVRGQRHMLSNIRRRKPVHSHSLQNQVNNGSGLADSEKKEYEEKIRRLEQEKALLQLGIQKNEARLQEMEGRQAQLVSLVSQLAKKPELGSINPKKRRLLESGGYSADNSDHSLSAGKENSDPVDKLDSSIKTVEEIFYGERKTSDFRLVSPLDEGTMSPCSVDIPSSPELVVCSNNQCSPKTPAKESELERESSSMTSVQPSGVNDHFWEYFLTEYPGIEEPENRIEESSDEVKRAMHMEHLAPAGRTRC